MGVGAPAHIVDSRPGIRRGPEHGSHFGRHGLRHRLLSAAGGPQGGEEHLVTQSVPIERELPGQHRAVAKLQPFHDRLHLIDREGHCCLTEYAYLEWRQSRHIVGRESLPRRSVLCRPGNQQPTG